jgi:carbon storage regulator CsrA
VLVLTRRLYETIVIGGNIRITLTAIQGRNVRIAIDAPQDVVVLREELTKGKAAGATQIAPADRPRRRFIEPRRPPNGPARLS